MQAQVIVDAARIVDARFEALGLHTALGFDPLIGTLRWTNNNLPAGNLIGGFILKVGTSFPVFVWNDEEYAIGSLRGGDAPAKGIPVNWPLLTYAFPLETTMTFDALTFLAPTGLQLGAMFVDYGQGNRILGLKFAELSAFLAEAIVTENFADVLTIEPFVAPPAEATLDNLWFERA